MDGSTYASSPLSSQAHQSQASLMSGLGQAAQHTLKSAIACVGLGVHSGKRVHLTLHPAAPDAGIVFRRSDLGIDIAARFDSVVETRLCTMVAAPERPDARVGTVEHVMAALSGCGIDNAIVELDGGEVPILDGSADPFVFLIDCAGVIAQAAPRRQIEILRSVRVAHGDGYAELRPLAIGAPQGLHMAFSIEFAAPVIGRQALAVALSETSFRRDLAPARTFTLAADVARMQASGLALGGSLDNALVVDGDRVLNPGGLRMRDEFVRHKLLDAVGDLALGGQLIGRYTGHRAGHALNNQLLRALYADPAAWRPLPAGSVAARASESLHVAA